MSPLGSKALSKSNLQRWVQCQGKFTSPAMKVLPVSSLAWPPWAPTCQAMPPFSWAPLEGRWQPSPVSRQSSTELQSPQNLLPELLENATKLSDSWVHTWLWGSVSPLELGTGFHAGVHFPVAKVHQLYRILTGILKLDPLSPKLAQLDCPHPNACTRLSVTPLLELSNIFFPSYKSNVFSFQKDEKVQTTW